jgi:hypothetical protein
MEFQDGDKPESDYLNGILGMTLLANPGNQEIAK